MSRASQIRSRTPRESGAPTSHVEIKTVTWNKDSHGLFDYENSTYDMKKFSVSAPSQFFRQDNNVQLFPRDSTEQSGEFLLSVSNDPSTSERFVIDAADVGRAVNPYLIVRSLKCADGKNQRGFALNAGQVIKLGRIEFRVLEVCGRAGQQPEKVDYRLYQHDAVFDAETQNPPPQGEEPLCRFCYSDSADSEEEVDNIMLYMCNCKGSAGGIHFKCLQTWINYKTVTKNQYNNIISYQLKKLECDVCLNPYPRRMTYKGDVYEFLTINKPQTPYIILERVIPEMAFASNISIVCLDDKQEVKIGRGHLCDLRVSDISVSRVHAMLKFNNEKFMLFDNDSKFGTLIQLEGNYPVRAEKAAIQIGRTVFTFVMKTQIPR